MKTLTMNAASLLNAFTEACFDGCWDWNVENQTVNTSEEFWANLGYATQTPKISLKDWEDFIVNEDIRKLQHDLEQHIITKGETPFDVEMSYKHRSGAVITVLCKGKVVNWGEDGEPLRIVGTHTNITRMTRKQKDEQQELTYLASHDLQAPIRHMISYLDILEGSLELKLNEKEIKCFEVIKKSINTMKLLVENILLMSKLNSSRVESRKVDLKQLVKNICTELKKEENIHDCFVLVDLPTIRCDFKMTQLLFYHLIKNAVIYRKPDSNPSICVSCKKRGDHFLFSVKDKGIGFDQKYSEEVFKPFRQLTKNKRKNATGIGLALCKRAVEAQNGEIWVELTPKKETIFNFTLLEGKEMYER